MKINWTFALALIAIIIGSTSVDAKPKTDGVIIRYPTGAFQIITLNSTRNETNGSTAPNYAPARPIPLPRPLSEPQYATVNGCSTRFVGNKQISNCF